MTSPTFVCHRVALLVKLLETRSNFATHTVRTVVSDAPILMTSSDKVAVDVDQTAVLTCRAHSLPGTAFTWKNGSEEIADGSCSYINLYAYVPVIKEYAYSTHIYFCDVNLRSCRDVCRWPDKNHQLVLSRPRVSVRDHAEHILRPNVGLWIVHVHRQQ